MTSGEPSFSLGAEVLSDPPRACAREWLLPDGLGGYASSTPLGLNTRRQHGLLVVATRPPSGRLILLSKVEEVLTIDGVDHELSSNAYPDAVFPRGFERAASFVMDPLPSLTWEVPEGRLTRTIARVQREPGVAVTYTYEGSQRARLALRPLVAYRDVEALQRENGALSPIADHDGTDVVLRPYPSCPPLYLRVSGAEWHADGYWYRQFQYERDRELGREWSEDLFSHGSFTVDVEPGETAWLLAWAGPIPAGRQAVSIVAGERKRSRDLTGGMNGPLGELRRAASAFLVRRLEGGRVVVGGYHWSRPTARDTAQALPGLCLTTGRHDDARILLAECARAADAALRGSEAGDAEGESPRYTVDAALWFIVAIERFLENTHDRDFVRSRLMPTIVAILDAYRDGTHPSVRMTPDGLILHGDTAAPLTWMDARVPGQELTGEPAVTPRRGHAVEVQALWYNALLIGSDLARVSGHPDRASEWTGLAALSRTTFLRTFWSDEVGYLADVVTASTRDLSLRPNQLYAVGLPHAVVPRDKAVLLLGAIKRLLLTPVGLRTLAPDAPAYRPRFSGDPVARETARHQGTVWPALMGIYFDSLVRVFGEDGKREARLWLRDFTAHLGDAGLGFVSEVFDAEAPHHPGGAIANAWAVAELLRVVSRLPARAPASRASAS
jgi:predicted glycogen debranching enzyme